MKVRFRLQLGLYQVSLDIRWVWKKGQSKCSFVYKIFDAVVVIYPNRWVYRMLSLACQIDVVYTDLENAFDKITHKRLISKLYSCKINPGVVEWIESCVTNRRQRVRTNGFFSFWKEVVSGIPQGLILGPFVYNLY